MNGVAYTALCLDRIAAQICLEQICAGVEDRVSDPLELEENPVSMDRFEFGIHGTGYPHPGGYDDLAY